MSVAPAVSVILPVHNRPEYLVEAAESILAQTFRDLELVIVDDCSDNPQTASVAADIAAKDPRVRVIRREKNGGVAAARNTGAAAARAPLIALMDDDDISEPKRLEKQVAFLKNNPEVASVACRKVIIDRRGRFVKSHSPPRKTVAVSRPSPPAAVGDDIPVASVGDFAPLNASAVFRREPFDAIGGYRECYRAAEDHDIILRMQEKFVMAELPEALYRYRQFRGERTSTSQHNWRANIAIVISARRRRLGMPDPMADGRPPRRRIHSRPFWRIIRAEARLFHWKIRRPRPPPDARRRTRRTPQTAGFRRKTVRKRSRAPGAFPRPQAGFLVVGYFRENAFLVGAGVGGEPAPVNCAKNAPLRAWECSGGASPPVSLLRPACPPNLQNLGG